MTQRHKTSVMAALLAIGVFSTAAIVQPAQAQEGPNTGRISLSAGMDIVTAYYFRGYAQENQGLIGQPWAEIGFNLYQGDDMIDGVDLYIGTWNSLHSDRTGAGATTMPGSSNSPGNWYETDFYAGVSFGILEDWTLDVLYTAYMSPNNAFSTIEEIGLIIAYDDSELLGEFSLSPYVGFFFETSNAGGGQQDNKYFEAGVEPAFELTEAMDMPLTISFPLTLGLDMDRYYGNRTFGYFDAGARVSVPLQFVPADFGQWSAHAGAHVIFANSNLRTINQAVTSGRSAEFYGVFGVEMSY
jgi:hypothetical protein